MYFKIRDFPNLFLLFLKDYLSLFVITYTLFILFLFFSDAC